MKSRVKRPVAFRVFLFLAIAVLSARVVGQTVDGPLGQYSQIRKEGFLFDQLISLTSVRRVVKAKSETKDVVFLYLLNEKNQILSTLEFASIYDKYRLLYVSEYRIVLADLDKYNTALFNFIIVDVVQDKLLAKGSVDKFLRDSLGKDVKAYTKESVFTAGPYLFLHLSHYQQDKKGTVRRAVETIVMYNIDPLRPRLDVPHVQVFRFKTDELRNAPNSRPVHYSSMMPQVAYAPAIHTVIYKIKSDYSSSFFPVSIHTQRLDSNIEKDLLVGADNIFLLGKSDGVGNTVAVQLGAMPTARTPSYQQVLGYYNVESNSFQSIVSGEKLFNVQGKSADNKLVVMSSDNDYVFCKELASDESSSDSSIGQYSKTIFIIKIEK